MLIPCCSPTEILLWLSIALSIHCRRLPMPWDLVGSNPSYLFSLCFVPLCSLPPPNLHHTGLCHLFLEHAKFRAWYSLFSLPGMLPTLHGWLLLTHQR